MTEPEVKAHLHRYLQEAREAVLWKLAGLYDHDLRRPLTPTGTNLLGLVKHLGGIETGYFGDTFGRPFGEPLPAGFEDDAEPNAHRRRRWPAAGQRQPAAIGPGVVAKPPRAAGTPGAGIHDTTVTAIRKG